MTKKWSKVLLKALVVFFAAFGTGFAISMYYAAGLGSDPYSMFVEALAMLAGTSVGTMSFTCNVVIVLWALIFARKYIGLGTFIQAVSVGVGIDTGARLWAYTGTGNLAVKLGFCFAAAVLVGSFIALYLACEMGCAPIDMLVLKVSATVKLRYQFAFYATYAVLFAIGVVLGGIWGVGTVIALLVTGWVGDALQPRLKELLRPLR